MDPYRRDAFDAAVQGFGGFIPIMGPAAASVIAPGSLKRSTVAGNLIGAGIGAGAGALTGGLFSSSPLVGASIGGAIGSYIGSMGDPYATLGRAFSGDRFDPGTFAFLGSGLGALAGAGTGTATNSGMFLPAGAGAILGGLSGGLAAYLGNKLRKQKSPEPSQIVY